MEETAQSVDDAYQVTLCVSLRMGGIVFTQLPRCSVANPLCACDCDVSLTYGCSLEVAHSQYSASCGYNIGGRCGRGGGATVMTMIVVCLRVTKKIY